MPVSAGTNGDPGRHRFASRLRVLHASRRTRFAPFGSGPSFVPLPDCRSGDSPAVFRKPLPHGRGSVWPPLAPFLDRRTRPLRSRSRLGRVHRARRSLRSPLWPCEGTARRGDRTRRVTLKIPTSQEDRRVRRRIPARRQKQMGRYLRQGEKRIVTLLPLPASVVAQAAGLDAGTAARDYIRRHDGNPIRRPAHPPLRVADR